MNKVFKRVLPVVLSFGMLASSATGVLATSGTSPSSPLSSPNASITSADRAAEADKHIANGNPVQILDDPDCTETGSGVYQCTNCHLYFIADIPATGHSYSSKWSSNATSHWHAATCRHNVTSDVAAHTWDNGTVTTAATAAADGVKTYKCTVCGATKTEAIAKIVMTVGTNYTSTAGYTTTLLSSGAMSVKVKNVTTKKVTVPTSVVVNGVTYKVTNVKGDAFNGKYVTSVVIPNGITKLNANAFWGDKKLTSIKINSKTLTVGKNLFKGLSKWRKRRIKVTVSKKMSKKNFNKLKKALVKQGLKSSNIKRK